MLRKIGLLALLGILAYNAAKAVVAGKPGQFLGPAIALAVAVLIVRKPYIAFVFGYLLLVRFFGLLYLHVPGFFKVFDLGLILCMVSGFIIWRSQLHSRTDIFAGPFLKVIILFTGYIAFQIIQTVVGEGQSLLMTVQIARFYLFYLLFFAAVPVFLYRPDWQKLLKWILIIAVIGAVIYVTQSIFNFGFLKFLFRGAGSNTLAGGNRVERLFGGISTPDVLIAGTLLGYVMYNPGYKRRVWFLVSLGIICLKPLLSFGRGYIAAFFTSLIVVVLFAQIKISNKIRIATYSAIVLLLFLGAASLLANYNVGKYAELVFLRMEQGYENYTEKSGTYELRYELRQKRIELINRNPVVGVGFLHPESGLYPEINSMLRSAHDGYGTLWGELGFLGFGIFIIFTAVIFLNAYQITRMKVPVFYRAFSLAVMGQMVSGYVNMLSTSSFILEASIANMGLSMAVMQAIRFRLSHPELGPVDGMEIEPEYVPTQGSALIGGELR